MTAVDAIRRSAQRMNHIVQDLLDVTRFEAGELRLRTQAVSANELLREVVEGHGEQVKSHGLELRLQVESELPAVWVDRQRIFQVFENLIGNAMKFTRAGTICIGAKLSADEVQFWVADTGDGVSEEQLPHLFDRFWRADKARRDGAGLGLGIAKAIIEAHAGRIWVESRAGRGTTFFFTLPTRPGSEGALEPVQHSPGTPLA